MDKGKLGTALALAGLIALTFFISAYFGYSTAVDSDAATFHEKFVLIGTDPYYHHRVIEYIQTNGELLYKENLNNYPMTSVNPRPPLFDYSQAVLGKLLSPLFPAEGQITSVEMATGYVMVLFPCIFGALSVIPIYFIAKTIFGRKIGLLAAALLATTATWLTDSVVGLADHDPFYMFFILCGFAFFVKALNIYKDEQPTIMASISNNKTAILYGALAGVSIAAVAMAWEGFLIATGLLALFAGFEMMMDKMRVKDPSGAWIVSLTALLAVLLLMLPYYISHNKLYYIYMQSFFTFAVLVAGLIFVPTKKLPGILVVPSGIIAGAIALLIVWIARQFLPATNVLAQIGNAIFGNIYYIQKSKVYTTVAEASSVSDISLLVFSYGAVTFFLSLAGVCWLAWRLFKEWRKDYVFLFAWSCVSLYLSITSHRFLATAAPAMAVLAAVMLYKIIQMVDFGKISKDFANLRPNGFWLALRKSIGAKQVVGAIAIAFLIVFPNVWFAVDAGIPGEVENKWVGEELSAKNWTWTRDNMSKTFAGHSFGAFGQYYDKTAWIPAMTWLAAQDKNMLIENRPAEISWWDYGFYCGDIGKHPTVADPFQEGIQPAGAFLLAQSESEKIAVMMTRILEKVVADNKAISEGVKAAMLVNGLNETQIAALEDVMLNPENYREDVLAHPEIFGDYVNETEEAKLEEQQYYQATSWGGLTAANAKYAEMRVKLSTALTLDQIVSLYHDICEITGLQIRYVGVEQRDITDIFAVFVKLTDRKPTDYMTSIYEDALTRNTYTVEEIEQLSATQRSKMNLQYKEIQYDQKFYNSSVYRSFFGYSGYDIFGEDAGIPGYSGQLYQYGYPVLTCWMQKHFRTVYAEPGASSVRISKFYEGAKLSGTIVDESGNAVAGAFVTVLDDTGVPHDFTATNATGQYSLIAPFSMDGKNITVVVTTGSMNDSPIS
ncbi:MAG: STT3 domain-containing protein, partial [Candidatus Thermoplasmatota archaeon]|nr:STT3 domain-containing protein [Candidatus Thermoplasmatota archaeon]